MENNNAIVLFSGGQDSTTCLFWAKEHFKKVKALHLYYGQRHSIEKESAVKIAEMAEVPLQSLDLKILQEIGDSGLFADQDISSTHRSSNKLPSSFVPGRNLFFLLTAAVVAYKEGYQHIVTGVCETDYSGYPDCRHQTMLSMELTLFHAMDYPFHIHTPLMLLSKKESIHLAIQYPGCYGALAYSHTCYEGRVPPCGKCPACILREKGFTEAGISDPLVARLESE